MKVVLDYLNNSLKDLENLRNEKETLMNRKIIEANEIHKTISKLSFDDNNTYNVFSASGSKMEFYSKESAGLKSQEEQLKYEADCLADEIKMINQKIEQVVLAIAHANSENSKLNTLSNEVIRLNGEVAMYSTGGKTAKKNSKNSNSPEPEKENVEETDGNISFSSNVDSLDITKDSNSFLEEVADRLYFISRILKFDPFRVKLELEEIYKSIIKYINK